MYVNKVSTSLCLAVKKVLTYIITFYAYHCMQCKASDSIWRKKYNLSLSCHFVSTLTNNFKYGCFCNLLTNCWHHIYYNTVVISRALRPSFSFWLLSQNFGCISESRSQKGETMSVDYFKTADYRIRFWFAYIWF